MIYKYLVRHNIGLFNYLKERTKELYFMPAALLAKRVEFQKPPCFIVGCGHSGTTLVAAKLGNHPECLTIARETSIFLPASNSLLCASRVLTEWQYFSRVYGDIVLVEKTPKHVHVCKRITRLVPDAKIIGVVRNPLDTISSLYRRFNDLDFSIERWLIDNNALVEEARANRLLTVKYEDLTRDPGIEFRRICGFIDVPFRDDMLAQGETSFSNVSQRGNMAIRQAQVSSAIQANVGTWRSILTDANAGRIIRRTRVLATELGYEGDFLNLLAAG